MVEMVSSQRKKSRSFPNAKGYVVAVFGTVAAIGGGLFAMRDAASETLSLLVPILVVASALIGGAGPALLAAVFGLALWLLSGHFLLF